MEKLKGLIKKYQPVALALLITVMSAPLAFAAEGDVVSTMTTAVTGVQTQFNATVTSIAPIAIGIVAVFMVWKLGMKFFRSITKA